MRLHRETLSSTGPSLHSGLNAPPAASQAFVPGRASGAVKSYLGQTDHPARRISCQNLFHIMRWGLIPSWAKDVSIGNRTLNPRSETATTTPAFRDSILTKRCLTPADGFYEWQKMGSVKQPYCFEVGEGEVFAFAGLDEWRSPDGEIIESCTILTTGPNSLVADLHDRMPVIVTPDKYDVWLDPDVNDFNTIRDILKPYDANLMRRYPVSRKLNNSKVDDADSASPVTLDIPTQGQLF